MTIHVLIVSYPAQAHINPLLRVGKRLASKGEFLVTVATTAYLGRQISSSSGSAPGEVTPVGAGFLRFDFFEDEWAETDPRRHSHLFLPQLELAGRKHISQMLRRFSDEGRPVRCLINGPLIPWVTDVAVEFRIPQAIMWTQSCASFLTFYSYHFKLAAFPTESDPYTDIDIPTLPLLKWDELHTFLHPLDTKPRRKTYWVAEFGALNNPFCILIDTFDQLEHNTLEFIASKLGPIVKPVGPLFKDPLAVDLHGDRLKPDLGCLSWLDSKPTRSVVYICFGPMAGLSQEQMHEIGQGISNLGLSFLWAMKPAPCGLVENGMVVEYSPQERVLAHPAVACFMTHCGWNSTMEALASGVPMVVYPQWGDQVTTAKIMVDVLGVGVRMGRGEHEKKLVPREEVGRCVLEATLGPKAEEMRNKVVAWKDRAEKAYQEGGTSDKCLQDFVDEIKRRST